MGELEVYESVVVVDEMELVGQHDRQRDEPKDHHLPVNLPERTKRWTGDSRAASAHPRECVQAARSGASLFPALSPWLTPPDVLAPCAVLPTPPASNMWVRESSRAEDSEETGTGGIMNAEDGCPTLESICRKWI